MSREGACRFDGTGLDLTGGVVNELGYPNCWMYHCTLCGGWHWTMPALETDGTGASREEAEAQQDAVVNKFYGRKVPEFMPKGGLGDPIEWPPVPSGKP